MKTHEELQHIVGMFRDTGWTPDGGGKWVCPAQPWITVRTGYCHQEATIIVEVNCKSHRRKRQLNYYRGAHPLPWALENLGNTFVEKLRKVRAPR